MNVLVVTSENNQVLVEIDENATVRDLKLELAQLLSKQQEFIQLNFLGKVLKDSSSLHASGVRTESRIDMSVGDNLDNFVCQSCDVILSDNEGDLKLPFVLQCGHVACGNCVCVNQFEQETEDSSIDMCSGYAKKSVVLKTVCRADGCQRISWSTKTLPLPRHQSLIKLLAANRCARELAHSQYCAEFKCFGCKDVTSSSFCIDCNNTYCDVCFEAVHTLPFFADHKTETIAKYSLEKELKKQEIEGGEFEYCNRHKGHQCCHVDVTTLSFLCTECWIELNSEKRKNVALLSSFALAKRNDICSRVNYMKTHLNRMVLEADSVATLMAANEEAYQQHVERIRSASNQLVEAVRARENRLLAQLRSAHQRQQEYHIPGLNMNAEIMGSDIVLAQMAETIQSLSNVEVIRRFAKISQDLNRYGSKHDSQGQQRIPRNHCTIQCDISATALEDMQKLIDSIGKINVVETATPNPSPAKNDSDGHLQFQTQVEISNKTHHSAEICWTVKSPPPNVVYCVELKRECEDAEEPYRQVYCGAKPSCVVTGLEPDTEYRVKVGRKLTLPVNGNFNNRNGIFVVNNTESLDGWSPARTEFPQPDRTMLLRSASETNVPQVKGRLHFHEPTMTGISWNKKTYRFFTTIPKSAESCNVFSPCYFDRTKQANQFYDELTPLEVSKNTVPTWGTLLCTAGILLAANTGKIGWFEATVIANGNSSIGAVIGLSTCAFEDVPIGFPVEASQQSDDVQGDSFCFDDDLGCRESSVVEVEEGLVGKLQQSHIDSSTAPETVASIGWNGDSGEICSSGLNCREASILDVLENGVVPEAVERNVVNTSSTANTAREASSTTEGLISKSVLMSGATFVHGDRIGVSVDCRDSVPVIAFSKNQQIIHSVRVTDLGTLQSGLTLFPAVSLIGGSLSHVVLSANPVSPFSE